METAPNNVSLGLEQVIKVVRRRAWMIAVCIVVAAGGSFAVSKVQTKEYTATAALLFNDGSVAQEASGVAAVGTSDPQGQRDTNLMLVQLADQVAQQTAAELQNGISTKQIEQAVNATTQGQSDIVQVSATWPQPRVAAQIANTFADAFIKRQRGYGQAVVQNGIALVRQQLAALSHLQLATPQGQSLIDRLESLRILKAMQGNSQLAQTATIPTSPSSPKVARNTILGGVLGLFLGLGLAFLLERLDRRFREPSDVEKSMRLPMLGLVPHADSPSSLLGGGTVALEPFRMLRAHLRYFNVDRQLRTLLVTSAQPAEGKTTVAYNLAAAAADMGTRTLLVEADLRKPTLAQLLELQPGVGLAGAIVGAAPLDQAIVSVYVEGRTNGDSERRLDVLPAGAAPPNPAELLESRSMEDILSWGQEHYEFVVIDTPPSTAVADAIPLMKHVDGVIVVARLGLGTRDLAERLRERLDNLEAPTLGVVVNDVLPRDASSGYGYGYGYGPSDESSARGPVARAGLARSNGGSI